MKLLLQYAPDSAPPHHLLFLLLPAVELHATADRAAAMKDLNKFIQLHSYIAM